MQPSVESPKRVKWDVGRVVSKWLEGLRIDFKASERSRVDKWVDWSDSVSHTKYQLKVINKDGGVEKMKLLETRERNEINKNKYKNKINSSNLKSSVGEESKQPI